VVKRARARECEIHAVVLDGGPGAPGSAAPLALALHAAEPTLDALSVAGQIEQVRAAMTEPAILVGWSWGAMLGALVAAESQLVRKLVLVSSGPFAAEYAASIAETRRVRSDSFDPIEPDEPGGLVQEVFDAVWPQAAAMRESGELLARALRIQCPVAAIHGDHDPHPADGVRIPLAPVLTAFHLLERCGHTPWNERHARERFFDVLAQECRS
jgi:pimeloyl-ACP methyl ester carboxylesterase